MVAAQNEEVLGVLDLVREKETDGFEGLFTSVYVVSEEQIVCFRREAAVLKQTKEVIVLAVNIAADLRTAAVSVLPKTHEMEFMW